MLRKFFAAIILLAFTFTFNSSFVFAQDFENPPCDNEVTVEHLKDNKYSKINLVKVTNFSNIVQKENVIEVTFKHSSKRKCHRSYIFAKL